MRELTGENAGTQMEHPDQAPALINPYRQTQSGNIVWEIYIYIVFPHNFVWGSCFWFSIPGLRLRRLPPRLLPTIFHMILLTHHLSHTTLSHTHTSLSTTIFHTPSLTHIFVNHHLSHTIFHTPSLTHHLSHTISHTPSFTHHLLHTHTHHLSHIIFAKHLFQPPSFTHHLSHTIFHTHLCQQPSFTHHLSHTIFYTHHLSHTISHTPSTFVSRGRCGTWRHPPPLCVAGVALMALGWLWWRAWDPFGRRWRRGTLRGRRGTWRHPPSFHVARVALGDMSLPFAWQAWH